MSLRNVVETLCSQRQDTRSNPEDIRSRFYEDYRKVAEEYDKEFMKRYDEDLNTTLIFVSLFIFLSRWILNHVKGWSVLRRDFCVHRSGSLPASA